MGTSIASDDGLVLLRPSDFSPMVAGALRRGLGRAPRTFTQWLQEEVYLPNDGGPFSGRRFRFSYQPIAALWAHEIDHGPWNEYIYTGPSQSGKSFIGYVCPFVYHVTELHESVGFGVPNEEMAGDKWKADIRPVLEASPRLKQFLPRSGPGSAGGTIRDRVEFSNATIAKILTAGGRDAAKAGYTLRTILITEAAAFSRTQTTSAEADPLEQLRARQRSIKWEERATYIEGTATTKDELPTTLNATSSQSRILSPCPHCGGWIWPTRENLLGWEKSRTEVEAAELASWYCPRCGEEISKEERREAVAASIMIHGDQTIDKKGRVSGDLPKTRRLWFQYGAWHNLFLDAGDIAVDLWAAAQLETGGRANQLAEKKLAQFVFGHAYEPPPELAGDVLEEEDIEKRRDKLPRGVAHADTLYLVDGVDVGERYCHWVRLGVRPNGQLHVIDYGMVENDRSRGMKEGLQEALTKLFAELELGVAREAGSTANGAVAEGRLATRWIYCDSGHLPEVVFAAAKAANTRSNRELVLPLLGRGETQMLRRRYTAPTGKGATIRKIDRDGRWHLSRVRRARIDQLTLDADCYKRLADGGFRTPAGSPGAITLFSGPGTVHRTFIRHQINEQFVTEELPDQAPVSKWICTGANHYKDALAYAICAATRLGWSPEVSEKPQKAWAD
jgi:phage terminase large subunit GpA-like protein